MTTARIWLQRESIPVKVLYVLTEGKYIDADLELVEECKLIAR